MNKRIKELNIEDYLFMDTETVRASEIIDTDSTEFDLFQYKNRDRVTSALLPDEEVVDLYGKTAALSPVYGKVVCISVGFIKGTTLYVKAIVGEENYVISEFYKILSKFKGTISFNGLRFDLPYLRIRSYVTGVHSLLANEYSDSDAKPWHVSETHIDVMDVIKGASYQTLSLEEACYLFGIPSSKDDISGSEVSKVFYSEGIDRIAKYCNKDVVATAKLFCKVSGRGDFIQEITIREDNPIEDLKKTMALTPSIITGLKLKGKELKNKKERKDFVEIIKALLQKADFNEEEEKVFKSIIENK